jgi:hypothetical protein
MRVTPQQQAGESVMAMGIPTDILLGLAIPPGNMDSGSSVNHFAAFHYPDENDSVGHNNLQDLHDRTGATLSTPARGHRNIHGDQDKPHEICPNWEPFLASLGSTASTCLADNVPESIRQLFLAQACSEDRGMAEFHQELARG